MKIQAAILALAIWLAPTLSHAQSGAMDETCTAAIANRAQFGRLIHLYGDSIARGKALGEFADLVDPTHPLYQFRSVASMANWALQVNSRPERFAYCGGISTSAISARVSAGIIRPGDMVILEDAGDYAAGPNALYSAMWAARVAAAAAGVTVLMHTTADYCANGNMACNGMQWDAQLTTQGAFNDAIRRAALTTATPLTASGSGLPGVTVFVDVNWIMDSWRASALSVDGVDVMDPDGVHPNVWGQAKLTQAYLGAANLRQYLVNIDPLQDLAEANYQALGYGSATFTPSRARAYVGATMGAN